MIIKNHRNKNRYYLSSSGKLWVRDFTKIAIPEDINNLTSESEYDLILDNEMRNIASNLANIDAEMLYTPNVIIVSDGFQFQEKQKLLSKLKNVIIIGTNRSLVKWTNQAKMDWYVVNNPYKECMVYLPQHNYYPRCIVSVRTNPDFIAKYRARKGVVYKYIPVQDCKFSSNYFVKPNYYIDDYRNSICAAMSLASKWEVRKLLLFCCDDVFEDKRSGAEQLPNGLWIYPQHKVSHGLMDGIAYWLKNNQVKVGNYSKGLEYKNITYINESELVEFFN